MGLLEKAKEGLLGLLEKPKKLLWSVLVKKAVLRALQAAASLVVGHNLDKVGVSIQIDPNAAAVAVMAALEAARNYLKQKYPKLGTVL